jgi:peptide/nickel transport system permease protein
MKKLFRASYRVIASFIIGEAVASVALVFVLLVAVAAIAGTIVAPYDPDAIDLSLRNMPPGTPGALDGITHFFGTDALGRDVLSRLIVGARVSMAVGILSVVLSGIIGVLLGLVAGYFRGKIDEIIMRLVDLQMSVPSLLIALLILYVFGGSLINVIMVLALMRWMVYARLTRGLMLSLREELFVDAARSIGNGNFRIVFKHMLPNLMAPLMILATLEVATVMLAESSLSFLGLGIQPPDTSWGQILASGREYLNTAWWLVTLPGLAILFTTLSFNILANTLRERTNPN